MLTSSIACRNRSLRECEQPRYCYECNWRRRRSSNPIDESNAVLFLNVWPTRVEIGKNAFSAAHSGKKLFNPDDYSATGSVKNKLYVAPALQPRKSSRGIALMRLPLRNLGSKRNYKSVRRDEELYEKESEVRISRQEYEDLLERAKGHSPSNFDEEKRNNKELSYPQANSTRRHAKELEQTVQKFENLAKHIRFKVPNDEKEREEINVAASKQLNMPIKSKIYNDLATVETPEADRIKIVEKVKKAFNSKGVRGKKKDEEPDISVFNKSKFANSKPNLPDPPDQLEQEVISSDVNIDLEIIGIRRTALAQIGNIGNIVSPRIVGTKIKL